MDYYSPEEMKIYQRMMEIMDQRLLEMGVIDRIMDDPAKEPSRSSDATTPVDNEAPFQDSSTAKD